jgi:glycosyltransferase involved in cell wall biosynthesis
LKVLFTNADLDLYAGTQVVVRDLALQLHRQGHQPLVYSRKLGDVAGELTGHGIEVTNDLNRLSTVPDVIHGQHHPLVMEALLRFPSVPAVFVCHAARGFKEAPVYFPRILRYVGIDDRCRKRLEGVPEVPKQRIDVILNAVDLERFRPRPPLPATPKRVAVFSNNASRFTHLPAVRRVCREMGIELEVLGQQRGKPVPNPEVFLPAYDLVFAKARCALEALAVGSAVVLCDTAGAGPLVTTANFDMLRHMNFGAGVLVNPVEAKYLRTEMARYNPDDAAVVSQRVRREADLKETSRQWIKLYADVIEEESLTRPDGSEELAAAALYFRKWGREKRIEWAKAQFRKLKSIPVIGADLHHLGRRIAREWTKNPEL